MNRRTFWIGIVIAALMRIWNIWDAPLWYDEFQSTLPVKGETGRGHPSPAASGCFNPLSP